MRLTTDDGQTVNTHDPDRDQPDRDYTVTWEIEVYAASPLDAIEQARTMLPYPGNDTTATVFTVTPADGTRTPPAMPVTPDEAQTIAHALDVAAHKFTENARLMRDAAIHAPDAHIPATVQGFVRLAEQFDRQAADARRLYPRFADL